MGLTFDIELIRSNKRFAENIYLSRVVCDILKRHGYSASRIGDYISKGHSTAIYMNGHTPDWNEATVTYNMIRYHERQLKQLRIKLLSL